MARLRSFEIFKTLSRGILHYFCSLVRLYDSLWDVTSEDLRLEVGGASCLKPCFTCQTSLVSAPSIDSSPTITIILEWFLKGGGKQERPCVYNPATSVRPVSSMITITISFSSIFDNNNNIMGKFWEWVWRQVRPLVYNPATPVHQPQCRATARDGSGQKQPKDWASKSPILQILKWDSPPPVGFYLGFPSTKHFTCYTKVWRLPESEETIQGGQDFNTCKGQLDQKQNASES